MATRDELREAVNAIVREVAEAYTDQMAPPDKEIAPYTDRILTLTDANEAACIVNVADGTGFWCMTHDRGALRTPTDSEDG